MKKIILILVMGLGFLTSTYAQATVNTVQAKAVIAKNSFKLGANTVTSIAKNDTTNMTSDVQIPTMSTIKKYVLGSLISDTFRIASPGKVVFNPLNGLDSALIFEPTFNNQVGTTYTLSQNDNGKVITFNNSSAITVTVPAGLDIGFNCTLVQIGVAQVACAASGTTLHQRQSFLKTAGQWGYIEVLSYNTNAYILRGDMSN